MSVDIIAATSFALGGLERDLTVSTIPSTPFLMRGSDQGQPTLSILINADHVSLARPVLDYLVFCFAILDRLETETVGSAFQLKCPPLILKAPNLVFDLAVGAGVSSRYDDCQRPTNVVGLFDTLFDDFTPRW